MKIWTPVLIAVLVGSISSLAQAATLKGIELPDQTTVDGKTLVLNGMGTRQATIFRVNVYVAGLYLVAKTHAPAGILKSSSPKKLDMVFMRDVGVKDMRKAWEEGLHENCGKDCKQEDRIQKIISFMTDMKKGEHMTCVFHADKLELLRQGTKLGEIEGQDFETLVLSIWLGDHPPNESLKKGLLGLSD